MRACTVCNEIKPLSEFTKDHSKKSGYGARCKKCKYEIHNKYRKERGYDAIRYGRNKESERERQLVRKYGVTLADYERMFSEQQGQCAICNKTQKRAFDVDHCHETGAVRGLLCTNCNRMIGHAADSESVLLSAAKYLESSRKLRRNS